MNINPVFHPLVVVLLCLIPFLIIARIVKTPWFKGKFGEFLVNFSACCLLDRSRYHLIKNVTLPTENGTTQIDHILVSEFGVFVVETKNMKGWIFGRAKQPFWTQKIFKSNYKFQNPLHQNYKHVKTLQALLGLSNQQVHSVVVFVGSSRFKTPLPDNVTQGLGYVRYIKSKKDFVLSPGQVAKAREKVASSRLKPSLATDRAHARHVRRLVAERHNTLAKSPSGWSFKLLIFSVLLLGIGAVAVNAVLKFFTEAAAIGLQHTPDRQVEKPRQPVLCQSEIQAQPQVASKSAGTKTNSDTGIQRVYQPLSELFLAVPDGQLLSAFDQSYRQGFSAFNRDRVLARVAFFKTWL